MIQTTLAYYVGLFIVGALDIPSQKTSNGFGPKTKLCQFYTQ